MIINRKKEEITVHGCSWKKVKKENVFEVIWKPTEPFVFTETPIAEMEGEINILLESDW